MIRWLDFNDTWPRRGWATLGQPRQFSHGDWPFAQRHSIVMREVLTAMIKAHEIRDDRARKTASTASA